MAQYRYTKDQRSALRKAVTSHRHWESTRLSNGYSSASLDIDTLEQIAISFGIDPAAYGTAKTARRFGPRKAPQARTTPAMLLRPAFADIEHLLTDAQRDYAADMFANAAKHGDMLTDKDAATLRSMIDRAHTFGASKRAAAEPIPAAGYITADDEDSTGGDPAGFNRALTSTDTAALDLLRKLLGAGAAAPLDESRIVALIKEHAGTPAHVTVDLRTPAGHVEPLGTELMHHKLPLVMAGIKANVPLYLVGDAGAGKTTMCKQIARMLGRSFYFTGAINSEFKLTGFIDAHGRIINTAFIKAFKEGGIFLFDEIDGSMPQAVLPFNAAVANRMADLPEGIVEAHPDFMPIAAANTTGRGADRLYCGRLQQDAAVLDRYAMLEIDTDEALEAALVGAPRPHGSPLPQSVEPVTDLAQAQALATSWVERVRKVRANVLRHKVRAVVSPRATINGAKLLAAGWSWSQVEESCLFKGIDADARAKIAA